MARDLWPKGIHVAYVAINARIDTLRSRPFATSDKPDEFFSKPTAIAEEDWEALRHQTRDVFDILGQKVRTLVADMQTAGFHQVVWDSRDDAQRQVAAGVYFYRLQAGEFTQVRKLLLLK